jgi:hypothetical protein
MEAFRVNHRTGKLKRTTLSNVKLAAVRASFSTNFTNDFTVRALATHRIPRKFLKPE